MRHSPEPANLSHSQLVSSAEVQQSAEKSDYFLVAPAGFHPNASFFGMEKELQRLHSKLSNPKKRAFGSVAVLVHGGSGAGKSHLARQYVFAHRGAYVGGIFWVDAKSKTSLFKCFWDIAQEMSSKYGRESQDLDWDNADLYVDKLRKWFESRSNWLLVFDGLNLGDDDLSELKRFLPYSKNSGIIYTSINSTLVGRQRLFEPCGLRVRPLSVPDARKLLFRSLGIKQPTPEQVRKATELVEYYECLPLVDGIHLNARLLINLNIPNKGF